MVTAEFGFPNRNYSINIKCKFDILASVRISMWAVNPQISEALIPFLFKLAKFPSSVQKLLHIPRKAQARRSRVLSVLLVGEQREDC